MCLDRSHRSKKEAAWNDMPFSLSLCYLLVLKVYVKPEPRCNSTLLQPSFSSINYNLPSQQKMPFFPWLAGRQTLSRRHNGCSQLILLNIKSWINKEGGLIPHLSFELASVAMKHTISSQLRLGQVNQTLAQLYRVRDMIVNYTRGSFSQAIRLVKEPVCWRLP